MAAALTGGAMVGGYPLVGRAQSPSLHKFILIFARGGWDVTWAPDPKDKNAADFDPNIIDLPEGQVVGGELPFFDADDTGGAVRTFFEKHGSKSAIIRGVTVRSIAHTTC